MLSTVQAYSSWKSAPQLPLSGRGPETDLIQIHTIDGLDPVKAKVNTVDFGSIDGAAYNGSLVSSRNIVLTVGLNPDWANYSMEELRRLLYAYFMPKMRTRLVFHSDDDFPTVEIFGYVEGVETNMFSKDVELQVSIICPDPYFTAVNPSIIVGSSNVKQTIVYNGSIAAGMNLKLTELTLPAPANIGVQVGDPAVQFFRVAATVSATKYFIMNSLPGQKYVQNVELGTGIITNLLPKMADGSSWPMFEFGENDFTVITDGGAQEWTLTYFEKFGGL